MYSTKDNLSFENSLEDKGTLASKPYLKKEYAYELDNNGSSNYNRNISEFTTTNWSNNGRFVDLSDPNAMLVIPTVTTVVASATEAVLGNDPVLVMKNDNLNIVDNQEDLGSIIDRIDAQIHGLF